MEKLKVKAEISELADNEEFRDIEGYEGLYQVTSYGRVFSLISKKFLKPIQNKNGYLYVNLYKEEEHKVCKIHRLVASAFIPNPQNLPQINHISEIKSDNRVKNLEWCTASYNNNYGTRTEKCSKPVLQFTREGIFVKEYPSLIEAERQTKISNGNISQCCLGKYKTSGGFIWKYKEEVA